MTPVRLALVGFGKWGRNYVRAARDSGEAQIVGIITRTGDREAGGPEHPHFFAARIGHAAGLCDAVVYAGHPSGAAEAAREALELGMPILIEKPAGLSVAEAELIQRAEVVSNGLVLIGHQHLFAERVEFLRGASAIAPLCIRWNGPAAHGFPHLWDYGAHAVSMLLALRGRLPDGGKVMCFGDGCTMIPRYGSTEDHVHVIQCNEKIATVHAETRRFENSLDGPLLYDGYAKAEPSLTRQVRAFARAVRVGGTDDWRFGAGWAVDVAQVLASALPR